MAGEAPRNTLGAYTEALIADVLTAREESLVKATIATMVTGTLEPAYAVQQWVAISEVRKLRATLLNRSKIENARIADQL